jgi:adenosylhomocysteine nucleosidase
LNDEFPANLLLIFYATSRERDQLRLSAKGLGLLFQEKRHSALGKYHKIGDVGDFHVIAARTQIGPFGYEGSASRGISFKNGTPATAIVQVGMAFGIDQERQRPGDVLLSTSLIPYDRKIIRPGDDDYEIDYSKAARQPSRPSMLQLLLGEAEREDWEFAIHAGAILSGGSNIYSSKYRDELVNSLQSGSDPIVGGEMEGIGLLSISPRDDPAWILVKGISDFADREPNHEETNPAWDQACRNAATFLLKSLIHARRM